MGKPEQCRVHSGYLRTQYTPIIMYLWILLLGLAFAGVNAVAPSHDKRVVCYLATWGVYLPGEGKFEIHHAENAAPFCTHIVLLFAALDDDKWEISAEGAKHELIELGGISKAVALKEKFPHLKIMMGIGGWNDGSVKYSRMARDPELRAKFVQSVDIFLSKHKLDGLDLNWQFPGERGGGSDDKRNIVSLVKELREILDRRDMILSVAVTSFPWRMDLGIDGKALAEHAHFLNILSYEYHAKWDMRVGPSAPLNANDNFSLNNTISRYLEVGSAAEKLNLGLSAYGTTFSLADPNVKDFDVVGSTVVGGFNGAYNDVEGFLAYNELCSEMQKDGGWTEIWHGVSQTPFARKADSVVSFDNPTSYHAKIELAIKNNLGGFIFYGLEKDDFRGACTSSKGPYPLLRSINHSILKLTKFDYDDIIQLLKKKNANYFWLGMKDE